MVQKNYDCDLCTSSFKGMEDLFSHVADAHKKHPCDMCEKVFLKKESLESHCKVVHHLKYECDLCNSSFKGMEELFFHVADAHKKHPCGMCDKVFLKMESLESHLKVVHMNLNEFKDEKEDVKEDQNEDQNEDEDENEEEDENDEEDENEEEDEDEVKKEEIERINRAFAIAFPGLQNASGLENDEKVKEEDQETLIEDDEEIDSKNSQFNANKNRNEEDLEDDLEDIQLYKCPTCDRHFATNQYLKIHIEKIHKKGSKMISCTMCGKVFIGAKGFNTHMRNVHSMPGFQFQPKIQQKREYYDSQLEPPIKPGQMEVNLMNSLELEWNIPKKRKILGKSEHRASTLLKAENDPEFEIQPKVIRPNINTNTYDCIFCGKTFTRGNSMKNHIQSVHEGRKDHMCASCGKSFSQAQYLKNRHKCANDEEIQKNKTLKFPCEQCSRSFSKEEILTRHIARRHENGSPLQIPCNFCNKSYTFRSMRWHKKKSHGEVHVTRVQCESCGKSFNKPQLLELHIKQFHEPGSSASPSEGLNDKGLKQFFCHLCVKSYTKIYHLKDHIKNSHKEDIHIQDLLVHINSGEFPKISCKPCGKTFDERIELAYHIKNVHEGLKLYKCRTCEKSYSSHQYLTHHNDTIHLGLQNFTCGKCDEICTDVEDLKAHITSVHDDSITASCEICSKKFNNKYGLNAHIKNIHNKIPCQFCGKKFNKSFVKTHIITSHTDDSLKPHKCTVCPKGFAQANKLKTHMNIHLAIKPYTCQYCPMGFADQGNMRNHEKCVHEGYKRSNGKLVHDDVKTAIEKEEKPKDLEATKDLKDPKDLTDKKSE